MSPTLLNHDAAPNYGPPTSMLLEALHDALVSERRLLDDLIAQMRQQRVAVSGDDIQGVDDSTFATHRILATLGQARQRRRQLNLLLGGSEDLTLRDLEVTLGDQIDARLRDARQRLQLAADLLAREVGMNRKLLREALHSGDQYVRTLVGAPADGSTYASDGPTTATSTAPRGMLVNRTA
jgi:flagellar biosynthesis/type III secretory pathway chaperone